MLVHTCASTAKTWCTPCHQILSVPSSSRSASWVICILCYFWYTVQFQTAWNESSCCSMSLWTVKSWVVCTLNVVDQQMSNVSLSILTYRSVMIFGFVWWFYLYGGNKFMTSDNEFWASPDFFRLDWIICRASKNYCRHRWWDSLKTAGEDKIDCFQEPDRRVCGCLTDRQATQMWNLPSALMEVIYFFYEREEKRDLPECTSCSFWK